MRINQIARILIIIYLPAAGCQPAEIFNPGMPGSKEYLLNAILNTPPLQPSPVRPYKFTFLTSSSYIGNFAIVSSSTANSMSIADALCSNDSNKPSGTTAKAFITGDANRLPGGTDWVLKTNTEYRRIDGTVIGTTDATAKFPPTLSSGLCSSVTTTYAWTGFSTTWTLGTFNCSATWPWTTGGVTGIVGDMGSTTTSQALDATAGAGYSCANSYQICCIEQ